MTEREERAQRLHDSGYNCAQAVVCAYCDRFGLDENTAFKMAEGFGLGMAAAMLAHITRTVLWMKSISTCMFRNIWKNIWRKRAFG